MAWRYRVLVALALVGCTEAHAPCTSNSECDLGYYCADGACESDCSATDPCSAGELCDSFGRCVMLDAGVDAGPPPIDAAPPPIDAGPPPIDATPPMDAGCATGTFGAAIFGGACFGE